MVEAETEFDLPLMFVCIPNIQGFGILLTALCSSSHSCPASITHLVSSLYAAMCPGTGREASRAGLFNLCAVSDTLSIMVTLRLGL